MLIGLTGLCIVAITHALSLCNLFTELLITYGFSQLVDT